MDFEKSVADHKKIFTDIIEGAEFSIGKSVVSAGEFYSEIISLFKEVREKERKVFLIGNGASASMASHFAVDLTKNARISSTSCNNGALLTCFSNDYSFETVFSEALKCYMKNGDILIAISSSGRSANILNAEEMVHRDFPASKVISFTGFSPDNPLRGRCDFNMYAGIEDYGHVESAHAYYLHLMCDLLVKTKS